MDPNKTPLLKRGATALLGAPLTATIAVWGYTTFDEKSDAQARAQVMRDEIVLVRKETRDSLAAEFRALHRELDKIQGDQAEMRRRIDRIFHHLSRRAPEAVGD